MDLVGEEGSVSRSVGAGSFVGGDGEEGSVVGFTDVVESSSSVCEEHKESSVVGFVGTRGPVGEESKEDSVIGLVGVIESPSSMCKKSVEGSSVGSSFSMREDSAGVRDMELEWGTYLKNWMPCFLTLLVHPSRKEKLQSDL